MNPVSVRQRIQDALAHRPFDCVAVYIYDFVEGRLVSCEPAAEAILAEHRQRILSALANASGKSATWRGETAGEDSSSAPLPLCYGACHIGPVVVLVAKPAPASAPEAPSADPIDGYFLDAVQVRVAEILGIDLTKSAGGVKFPEPGASDDLSEDLRMLETFEPRWRRIYGAEQWLAVKGGTVVAHGPSRKGVEQGVRDSGLGPPVLYVPPKKEERICEMFSIGL
jgi:hypothetical protein